MSPETRRLVHQERWRRVGLALVISITVALLGFASVIRRRAIGYRWKGEPGYYGQTKWIR